MWLSLVPPPLCATISEPDLVFCAFVLEYECNDNCRRAGDYWAEFCPTRPLAMRHTSPSLFRSTGYERTAASSTSVKMSMSGRSPRVGCPIISNTAGICTCTVDMNE